MLLRIFALSIVFLIVRAEDCMPRDYGKGGTVCVCNAQHCDTIAQIKPQPPGGFLQYTSTKSGLRFHKTEGKFNTDLKDADYDAIVMPDQKYQSINGFGGAITDSACLNAQTLNNATREKLMRSYFSDEGLEYNLCRVPIAGTDFSTHPYTYDDVPDDVTLTYFTLQDEDRELKIPFIKEAMKLSNNNMKLFASAWSAPKWMKFNLAYGDISFLSPDMYQVWANYHLKFLDLYAAEGIKFWAITTGNEPSNGYVAFITITSMGWLPVDQGKWIAQNLGPSLAKSSHSDIKIIALDDQRIFLPWGINLLFRNEVARKYVSGIGVHWYLNFLAPSIVLNATHYDFPDKFILGTEACSGYTPFDPHVILGSWTRGEGYMTDIMENMENFGSGWVDWNLALNLEGGPTYIKNFVDSAIIVNETAQEFYKQPMYYAIGHFSKFVPRDSRVIRLDKKNMPWGVNAVAFERPDNGTVLVMQNKFGFDYIVTIKDARRGILSVKIPRRSFHSVVYW